MRKVPFEKQNWNIEPLPKKEEEAELEEVKVEVENYEHCYSSRLVSGMHFTEPFQHLSIIMCN